MTEAVLKSRNAEKHPIHPNRDLMPRLKREVPNNDTSPNACSACLPCCGERRNATLPCPTQMYLRYPVDRSILTGRLNNLEHGPH